VVRDTVVTRYLTSGRNPYIAIEGARRDFDHRGDPRADGQWVLTYDYHHRLVRAEFPRG